MTETKRWVKVSAMPSSADNTDPEIWPHQIQDEVPEGTYYLVPAEEAENLDRFLGLMATTKPIPPPWAPKIRCEQDHDHDDMWEADYCDRTTMQATIVEVLDTHADTDLHSELAWKILEVIFGEPEEPRMRDRSSEYHPFEADYDDPSLPYFYRCCERGPDHPIHLKPVTSTGCPEGCPS